MCVSLGSSECEIAMIVYHPVPVGLITQSENDL